MSTPQVVQDFVDNILPQIGGKPALEEAVRSANEHARGVMIVETPPIVDADSYVKYMTGFLHWVPWENSKSTEVLKKLSVFYYVLDQPALAPYQNAISPDSEYKPLTPLSAWIVEYAKAVGAFMATPESLTPQKFDTFKRARLFRVWECVSPDGSAFHCFNDFFSRKLAKPRIVAGPGDNHTPVYPADSLWADSFDVDDDSNTWVPADTLANHDPGKITAKGWTWSIQALLQDSPYATAFGGGVWLHSFLSTFNYHRFHAPVSGTVVDSRVIQNAAYLDVIATGNTLVPRRRIHKDIDAEDQSGYQFLQTRGCVVIDTTGSPDGDIGLVAVLPIGMAQVSSVNLTVKPGDSIKKGDEFGFFLFGGSDIVTVFQAKAGFSAADPNTFNKETSVDEEGNELPYTFYGTSFVNKA
ncbi:phosphatidylserine decarboxylase-domain-containing protein [Lasiosphaeria miniovina]|uniref:Phosphatidylserine decarboxylase-domain-containing protein n=1 Tax=Lasiosphaeria miniovina TaxID=1954250 RepID=A0AA40BFZ3_9PEZI|nr:phosphatidylserine decarboxylase-domain-containing protein [Lasiosphaeria miniovina]KAK0733223.1 phosphatidylserine decarboxylase-domain-containing protein [Lasiosphaeria miniovina]